MFDFIKTLFGQQSDKVQLTRQQKDEVSLLLKELVQIGIEEDYLSERPGGAFNAQCHHRRAREIGAKLNQLGGMPLMWECFQKVQRKAGKVPASHLEYAWAEIGDWMK